MTERGELTLEDYLRILRRRWPIIFSWTRFATTHFLPKRYTSQTLVLVQQPTVPGDYVKPVVSEGTGERLATMQQEILSRTRLEPIVQQFGLYREDVGRVAMSLDGQTNDRCQPQAVTPQPYLIPTRSNWVEKTTPYQITHIHRSIEEEGPACRNYALFAKTDHAAIFLSLPQGYSTK